MSSGKSEEEARLLDQKIAEIRRKNEALLKRRQEIEEDRKLAEKRNAVVQLKPTSIEDWPRERTPALRPSNRDVLGGGGGGGDSLPKQAQFDSPIPRGGSRGGKSRRGEDLIGKGAGPPPDPRSFLADPDRDPVDYKERPDKSGRSDAFGQGSPGVREYQRGGGARGRGGRGGRRGDSGRRGDHSSPYTRNDEAWREERHKIDEARIQRQKCADGKWRREWDNEKLEFESLEASSSAVVASSSASQQASVVAPSGVMYSAYQQAAFVMPGAAYSTYSSACQQDSVAPSPPSLVYSAYQQASVMPWPSPFYSTYQQASLLPWPSAMYFASQQASVIPSSIRQHALDVASESAACSAASAQASVVTSPSDAFSATVAEFANTSLKFAHEDMSGTA